MEDNEGNCCVCPGVQRQIYSKLWRLPTLHNSKWTDRIGATAHSTRRHRVHHTRGPQTPYITFEGGDLQSSGCRLLKKNGSQPIDFFFGCNWSSCVGEQVMKRLAECAVALLSGQA